MTISFTHKLIGGDKTYTFTIGGGGCEKRVTHNPVEINNGPIKIYGFGQDSIAIFKSDTQLILSLADGHGPTKEGKDISYRIHDYILSYISDSQSFILDKLRRNDYDSVKITIKEIFANVNDIILNRDEVTSKYYMGGTTLTILHKIIDSTDGTLYSLSYNIGDSPYLKINYNNELEELSANQTCDNIKCVEEYYNHCLSKGINPSPIILGRFNMPNCFKASWMGHNTINPYKSELVDGKYILTPNTTVMKQFYENAPAILKIKTFYIGGSQTIRGRYANIKALKNGLFPMENFGSTINGNVQNIHSFGDRKSIVKNNILCIPYISISKINEPHYDFVGSDGPIDCLSDDDILTMFKDKQNINMDEFLDLVKNTINLKAIKGGFNLSSLNNVPTWDDNSYWIVDTTIEKSLNKIPEVKLELEHKIKHLEIEQNTLLEYINTIKSKIGLISKSIVDKMSKLILNTPKLEDE